MAFKFCFSYLFNADNEFSVSSAGFGEKFRMIAFDRPNGISSFVVVVNDLYILEIIHFSLIIFMNFVYFILNDQHEKPYCHWSPFNSDTFRIQRSFESAAYQRHFKRTYTAFSSIH